MASLLIRNFDDSLKETLRRRAAVNKRSMEEEARVILGLELRRDRSLKGDLGSRIHAIAMEIGGMDDLVIPPRSEMVRKPPFVDDDSWP